MNTSTKDLNEPIAVVQIGLGPIGQRMVRRIIDHRRLTLAGAVDIDEQLHGKDVGEVCGLDAPLGVDVVDRLDAVQAPARVASVMSTSSIQKAAATFRECARAGLHVVSTCEELAYPWQTQPQLSAELDQAAKANDIAMLGTGVNPGFLMDLLPLTLTGVCERVEAIRVERYQDAGKRRLPFQIKVGATLSPEEFEDKVDAGFIRHVGLTESMHLLAARLGWALTRTIDRVEAIVAHERHTTPDLVVEPGQVRGVHQVGKAWVGDDLVIELIFHAAIGQPKPQDRVVVRGTPGFESVIPGGIHGDIATTAMAINAIPLLLTARPGLRTMADVEAIGCFQ